MTEEPHEGEEYQYEDGTVEVVFAVTEGRILTVREYAEVDDFWETVKGADPRGLNPLVKDLSLDVFQDETET